MKQRLFIVICLILFGIVSYTPALDLRISGGLGNNAFDPARKLPLGTNTFSPHYYPRILVDLEGDFSNYITFGASFERDPILRNRLGGTVGLKAGYVHLDMGPFMGVFNSADKAVNPGISAAVRLEIPGILYGTAMTASTIGANMNVPGNYIQSEGEAALGVWVPFALTVFSIRTRSYTEQKTSELSLSDEQTRYQLGTEIFAKNMPYTIRVDIGYQSLRRTYAIVSEGPETNELRSVYAGFEGVFTITPMLKLLVGMEMPVYNWGQQPLKGPPSNTVLFDLHTGVILTFP
ncbi:MAG: hypothetical protein LBQ38_03620 [Spirochaetaceae bacterium]|jgi:hypothetical protein|nr:hypothetical protein [Spirochaetaceae bacterium]